MTASACRSMPNGWSAGALSGHRPPMVSLVFRRLSWPIAAAQMRMVLMVARADYLKDVSPECPLIRIYSTEPTDFKEIYNTVRCLSEGTLTQVDALSTILDRGLSIESFVWCIGESDSGIVQSGECAFSWILTYEGWRVVGHFMEPFLGAKLPGIGAEASYSWQWLAGKRAANELGQSEISVLISTSALGRW